MSATVATNWFTLFHADIDWSSVTVGVKLVSRCPDLRTDYSTTFSIVESVDGFSALPEWVPCSTQPVPYTSWEVDALFGFQSTISGESTIYQLVYYDPSLSLPPASIEEDYGYAGWKFVAPSTQEQVSAAVFYIVDGADATITASVSGYEVTDNIVTVTTSSNHRFSVDDVVTVSGIGSPYNGTFTVTETPTASMFSYVVTHSNVAFTTSTGSASITTPVAGRVLFATTQGIGTNTVAHTGAMYGQTASPDPSGDGGFAVKVTEYTGYSAGTTISVSAGYLALQPAEPPWESAHAHHLWIEPQRTNFIANPSFEGEPIEGRPFGWRVSPNSDLVRVARGAEYCGAVSSETSSTVVIESNLFPAVGSWSSVSFLVRSEVEVDVKYGLVSFDGAYKYPFMGSPETLVVAGNPLGAGEATVYSNFSTINGLFKVPDGSVEMCLRIEVTPTQSEELGLWTFWVDKVLVDPHEGQFQYFDGNSTDGLSGDYRWMGGSSNANRHFSLWYNNFRSTRNRLLGGYEGAYKAGLVEEWAPAGSNIIGHWDAVTSYTPRNWEGNAFYPIADVSQSAITTLMS